MRKELPGHLAFSGAQGFDLGRQVGLRLGRQGLEEPHQLLDFSLGEIKRRHADVEIRADPVAVQVGLAKRGVFQEAGQPLRIQPGPGADQERRQFFFAFGGLVAGQRHQHRFLPDADLVAALAIVLGNDPPAFLDVFAATVGPVEVILRELGFGAAQQEGGERGDAFFRQVGLGHPQLVERLLDFPLVEDRRVVELLFEESLVVVPIAARRFGAVRQGAPLGLLGEQGEVQPLNGLAALDGQVGPDSAFVFQAGNLVAAGAAEVLHPEFALFFQLRVVQVLGRGILGRVHFTLPEQVGGDVAGLLPGQPQPGHYRAGAHAELGAVVRTSVVLGIEDEGKTVLGVVFGGQIALLERAVRPGALARVVNPPDQVLILCLLTYAAQVGGESSAHSVFAFSDRVAGQAAPGFK